MRRSVSKRSSLSRELKGPKTFDTPGSDQGRDFGALHPRLSGDEPVARTIWNAWQSGPFEPIDVKNRTKNRRNRRRWTTDRLIRDREAPGSNPGPRPTPEYRPQPMAQTSGGVGRPRPGWPCAAAPQSADRAPRMWCLRGHDGTRGRPRAPCLAVPFSPRLRTDQH